VSFRVGPEEALVVAHAYVREYWLNTNAAPEVDAVVVVVAGACIVRADQRARR
jgi:hypothetical protein